MFGGCDVSAGRLGGEGVATKRAGRPRAYRRVLSQTRVWRCEWPWSGVSSSEDFELLGQRRRRIVGVSRLPFAHHMNHLDAHRMVAAVAFDLKPSIGRTRRLIRR